MYKRHDLLESFVEEHFVGHFSSPGLNFQPGRLLQIGHLHGVELREQGTAQGDTEEQTGGAGEGGEEREGDGRRGGRENENGRRGTE